MTISEYLHKKRQDNPDFATLSDLSLYKKLKIEEDPNLSQLETGIPTKPLTKPRGQKS